MTGNFGGIVSKEYTLCIANEYGRLFSLLGCQGSYNIMWKSDLRVYSVYSGMTYFVFLFQIKILYSTIYFWSGTRYDV